MRRSIALLLTLVMLGTLAVAQPIPADVRYGKSEAQMLEMGREKWFDFYCSQAGHSTAAMADAERYYAQALRNRNAKLIANRPTVQKQRIEALRKHMETFAFHMVDVGRSFSGGGTIWVNIAAGAPVDIEEVVYGLMGGKVGPAPKRVVSDVTKRLDAVSVQMNVYKSDLEDFKDSGMGYNFAKSALLKARQEFEKIRQIAAKLERRHSDFVLEYCADWADVSQDMTP
jgi:hypothetical protein